jgi:hypothetical protein
VIKADLQARMSKILTVISIGLVNIGRVHAAFDLGLGDDSDLFNFVSVRSIRTQCKSPKVHF